MLKHTKNIHFCNCTKVPTQVHITSLRKKSFQAVENGSQMKVHHLPLLTLQAIGISQI